MGAPYPEEDRSPEDSPLARVFRAAASSQGFDEPTEPFQASEPLLADQMIGRFRLLERIGCGGQGEVWRAEDTRTHLDVAIKFLLRVALLGRDAQLRQVTAMRLASRIRHPGIAEVLDIGEDDGVNYVVTRFIQGTTLQALIEHARKVTGIDPVSATISIQRNTPAEDLPRFDLANDESRIATMCDLIEQTARILHAGHEAGLTHRAVKPANIMVTHGGEPVVVDFGLVCDQSARVNAMTRNDVLLRGTTTMAPEQFRDSFGVPDVATDVFALGATLYECLTLVPAFRASTLEELERQICEKDPIPPRRRTAAISRDLDTVVMMALSKNPEERYASAEAFANDLSRIRVGMPIQGRRPSTFARVERRIRRHPAMAAGAAIVLMSLVGIALFSTTRTQNTSRAESLAGTVTAENREWTLNRAFAQMNSGDLMSADANFSKLRHEAPADPLVVAGLAFTKLGLVQPSAALSTLEESPIGTAEQRMFATVKNATLRRLGRPEEAEEVTAGALAAGSHLACFLRGLSLLNLTPPGQVPDYVGAEAALAEAVLRTPRARAIYHYEWVRSAGYLGKLDRIRAIVQAIDELWPNDPLGKYWTGWALVRGGANTEGLQRLMQAVRGAPEYSTFRLALADSLRHAGRYDDAVIEAEVVLRLDPLATQAHIIRAECLMATERLASAAESLETWAELEPDSPEPRTQLAKVLRKLGRLEDAVATWEMAITIRDQSADAHVQLASVLDELQRKAEAVGHRERALELDPSLSDVRLELARHMTETARFDEAIGHLVVVREQKPHNDSVVLELSRAKMGRGDIAEALHEVRVEFEYILAEVEAGRIEANVARNRLESWILSPALARTRYLPAESESSMGFSEAWVQFWDDVRAACTVLK